MFKFLFLFGFTLLPFLGTSQITDEQIDSILNTPIPDQEIEDVVIVFRDEKTLAKLRRDVLKAYPYALRAASIINQIEEQTAELDSNRKRKKYIKSREKLLRDQFEKNLRKLTKTQGRYMVRLINRETDQVVYDLIKEYKGGVNARFWQMIAKKYNSDLKSEYNPENWEHIDFEIEQIIEQISPMYKIHVMNSVEVAPPEYRDFQ